MNLFGKKKDPVVAGPSPVEAMKNLREKNELIEKREELLNKKIEAALNEAKLKSLKKDKNGALYALKRKKMLETEVAKLQGTRMTLEKQIITLEGAAANVELFKAIQGGANALKSIRGDLDADKVDDIMDAIEEESDIQNTISEAISRPAEGLFDDEELLNELAELEALETESKLLNTATPAAAGTVKTTTTSTQPTTTAPITVFNLPSVPTSHIHTTHIAAPVEESEDERALRELQASMLA